VNVEDYISSGIVESYVLGLADEAERAEFEEMCSLHPEVKAALISFEEAVESYTSQNAATPPDHVRKTVFSQLGINDPEVTAPVVPITTETNITHGDMHVPVINNRLKYIAAASVILLITSAILNFYFFGQYKKYNNRYTELLAAQQQLVESKDIMQTKLNSYQEDLNLLNDTNTIIIRMPGTNVATSPDPSSLATVYWNKQSKDVYLHVNKMPKPSADKQYQLWALVDGKPVDAGVFDMDQNIVTLKMKNIPRAQAFAVTLEKRGGSPSPNMQQLYILGKV
jgi:anti-sigma-K factor RskA